MKFNNAATPILIYKIFVCEKSTTEASVRIYKDAGFGIKQYLQKQHTLYTLFIDYSPSCRHVVDRISIFSHRGLTCRKIGTREDGPRKIEKWNTPISVLDG